MSDKRRFFIIRAQKAKALASQLQPAVSNVVQLVINGRPVSVTDQNRRYAETMLARDAEQAFESAVFGRPYQSRIAIAA